MYAKSVDMYVLDNQQVRYMRRSLAVRLNTLELISNPDSHHHNAVLFSTSFEKIYPRVIIYMFNNNFTAFSQLFLNTYRRCSGHKSCLGSLPSSCVARLLDRD